MKQLYTLTLCALTLVATLSSSAQTGGTYTANLPGNWHTPSGPPVWVGGSEPPAYCNNCLITLNVPSDGAITMNVHLVLANNSRLIIGGASNGTILFIGNSSATDSAHGNGINLINDGTNSSIQLMNNQAIVVVENNTSNKGDFDGIFTTVVTPGAPPVVTTFKQVGYSPNGFVNGNIVSTGPVANNSLVGPMTLTADGTLPILLSSFTAALSDGSVNLAWTTQLEVNSDRFIVERSSDAGSTWTPLGTVAAHGNTTSPINYNYTDNKPGQGTNEYRLQMVDKDGKYAYSEVRAVRLGLVTSVSVYPNPARDYVNVTLPTSTAGNVLIRLFNQSGQLLLEKNQSNAGGTTVPLSVSNYPEGNYIIVVAGEDGSKQVSKLLIAK